MEYALSLNVPCPNCPGNVQPHTLPEIAAILGDLATNQHLRTFREIIPLALLSPNGTSNPSGIPMPPDATNFTLIDAVVGLFKKYNAKLILSVGNPIPAWAAPWGSRYGCFLPTISEGKDFNTFTNNIGWAIGNYLNHLKKIGYSRWMDGGGPGSSSGALFIEGFNEWNSNGIYTNCSDLSAATPERAALVENAIRRIADFYGVKAKLAAPSVVFPSQGLVGWYTAYYAAGGEGAPNVHIYGNGSSLPADSEAAVQFARSQLRGLIGALPARYRKSVIWGETGFGQTNSVCNGLTSLPGEQWTEYDAAAAKLVSGGDPIVTDAVKLLTVWRLDQLSNQSDCEGYFGIVTSDLKTYLPSAVKMLTYLGGSGVMGQRR